MSVLRCILVVLCLAVLASRVSSESVQVPNAPSLDEAAQETAASALADADRLEKELAQEPEVDVIERIAALGEETQDIENQPDGVTLGGDVVWKTLSNMEKADFYFANGNYLLAERFYVRVLEKTRVLDDQKRALLQLAEVYYARDRFIKAINIMEESLDKFPTLNSDPEFVYRMAEFYRSAEMRQEAVELFYKVINMIVVASSAELDQFIDLARMAKFQIARALYEAADYDKAFGAFNRIDLLEMSESNHEVVMYYKILASLKSAKPQTGRDLIEEFFDRFPTSEYTPELMYLRAEIMMGSGEIEEGSRQLIELLEYVESDEVFSREWTFWRQQAGNRLANRYYAEGDYLMALRIYQGVVSLNESPSWRLPIVYQMSLCFEKLDMYDRARESYTFLLEDIALVGPAKMTPVLEQLRSSAEWRLKVLTWREDKESDAASLLNQPVGT